MPHLTDKIAASANFNPNHTTIDELRSTERSFPATSSPKLSKRSGGMKRVRFSQHQLGILNRVFESGIYFLSEEQVNILSCQLQVLPKSIRIWFQNRRQQWRKTCRSLLQKQEDQVLVLASQPVLPYPSTMRISSPVQSYSQCEELASGATGNSESDSSSSLISAHDSSLQPSCKVQHVQKTSDYQNPKVPKARSFFHGNMNPAPPCLLPTTLWNFNYKDPFDAKLA